MGRKSSKNAILDAADRVLNRQGLSTLTIDAVVQEAGISKGGLFYHFASKKDMLEQLLDRYVEQFRACREKIMSSLPDTPGRLLKATIIASVTNPIKNKPNLSNLFSLLDDVGLREKIRLAKQATYREICEKSGQPEKIAIALLATDGLWLSELFGDTRFDDKFKQGIIDELLRLIDFHDSELFERQSALVEDV